MAETKHCGECRRGNACTAREEGEGDFAEMCSGFASAPIDYQTGHWFEPSSVNEMQAFFVSRVPAIREAARACGYAIGLHGSMRRDLDLIAVPWRDGASSKDELAHAIALAACGLAREGRKYQWETKPAGRVATSLPLCWVDHDNPEFGDTPGMGHIDLSAMPETTAPQPSAALIAVLEEALLWDGVDDYGVPAVWAEKARAAIRAATGEK